MGGGHSPRWSRRGLQFEEHSSPGPLSWRVPLQNGQGPLGRRSHELAASPRGPPKPTCAFPFHVVLPGSREPSLPCPRVQIPELMLGSPPNRRRGHGETQISATGKAAAQLKGSNVRGVRGMRGM